jgi:hypothetical protein
LSQSYNFDVPIIHLWAGHLGTSPLLLRLCYGLVFQEPEFVKNEIRKTFKRKDPEFE